MNPRNLQLAPPSSWIDFENLCHALACAHWEDSEAQKNGRQGQAQHGVDIWGCPNADYGHNYHAIQCKGKNANYGSTATADELKAEVSKADKFKPALSHWIFATTAPRDQALQKEARQLSEQRRSSGKFTLKVWSWDDIQDKLCDYPDVLRQFYPEQADNIPALIEAVKEATFHEASQSDWSLVTFEHALDFKRALAGKKLGPNDALSCPRLFEADALVKELQISRTARLIGPPGAGKSVCVYQASHTLSQHGFSVAKLLNPNRTRMPSFSSLQGKKTVALIDDAHLMPLWLLEEIEQSASAEMLILSTLNEVGHESRIGEHVSLDPKRAVRTIAKDLRTNLYNTMDIVSELDPRIGPRMLDEDIEPRIEHAEEQADSPWQFCFILGGGWHRAGKIADAARAQNSDLIVAIASALQIAGRDAVIKPNQITVYSDEFSANEVQQITDKLASDRVLLDAQDCRTPHQRFAAALLKKVLEGQTKEGRQQISCALNRILVDDTLPLPGLRNLLHELRFGSGNYRWTYLVAAGAINTLLDRCMRAKDPDEINIAALTMDELDGFDKEGVGQFVLDQKQLIADWISSSKHPSGYGLARLVNSMGHPDRPVARAILDLVDPSDMATLINEATPETAYSIAELASRSACFADKHWVESVRRKIDQQACQDLAIYWPEDHELHSINDFCKMILWYDRDLSFLVAQALAPIAKRAFKQRPFETQRALSDILSGVLYLNNILGVYPKPSAQQKQIGRLYLEDIVPEDIAAEFSTVSLRQLQNATFFMDILQKIARAKYEAIIQEIDWNAFAGVLEKEWDNPSHEAQIVLGSFYGTPKTQQLVVRFLDENKEKLSKLPPRWAIMAPQVALYHIDKGKEVLLANHDHVNWRMGALFLAIVTEGRPEKLSVVLEQCRRALTESLSQRNKSWFREAEPFLKIVKKVAPDFLVSVVSNVDPNAAKQGWVDSLRAGKQYARAVAILIDVGVTLNGEVGDMSKNLRRRFPKSSIPPVIPEKLLDCIR